MKTICMKIAKIYIFLISSFFIIIISLFLFLSLSGNYVATYKSELQNNIWFDLENHTFSNDINRGNYSLFISPKENEKNIIVKNLVIKTSSSKIIKEINELEYPFKVFMENINYEEYIVSGEIFIKNTDIKNKKDFKVTFVPKYKEPRFISMLDNVLNIGQI